MKCHVLSIKLIISLIIFCSYDVLHTRSITFSTEIHISINLQILLDQINKHESYMIKTNRQYIY